MAADEIKIGNGMDEGVFLGPVIRAEHKEKTLKLHRIGHKEGAVLLRDGREDACNAEAGYFSVRQYLNVTTEMRIWEEEIFAPVLSIVRVATLEEAMEITNQSEFANGACLFTESGKSVRYFREKIEAGMLGVNLGVPAPMAFFPFSG